MWHVSREKRARQGHTQQDAAEPPILQPVLSSTVINKGLIEETERVHTPPTPPTTPTPRRPPTPPTPVAPERDFAKVANSIVREAVAGGYFTGKSKQLYDFLYSRTRGAIITSPKHTNHKASPYDRL